MKKLYLIPGFGESTRDPAYRKISQTAKKAGYLVVPVNPHWNYSGMDRWVRDFENMLSATNEEAVVLGFSFGAMIASAAATNHSFKKILFCSLSPYFKEDLGKIPAPSRKWLGKRRLKNFARYSFKPLEFPAVFMMGEDDWTFGLAQTKKRYESWLGPKHLVLIQKTGHDIGTNAYQDVIRKFL